MLQAYALQEFLSARYGKATILDYHNEDIDKSYERPAFRELVKKPKKGVFKLVQSTLFKNKHKKIDQFRKKYLRLSESYNKDTIREANRDTDVFITGSDQVWNYLIIKKDATYFLDFVDAGKKKCSYAASIGVKEIPEEYAGLYTENIPKIDKISVRETAGVTTLSDLGIKKDIEIMPDPTLLLSKEQWESISILPERKKYILVYKITKADKLLSFAKSLAKKTGLKIIYIPNDLKAGAVGSLKLGVGPAEWMGYIRSAEYVVTNSFHGTVFSIIFGVKFFSEVSEKVNPSTSRLLTLLSQFGLEKRIIDRYQDEMLNEELDTVSIENVRKKNIEKAELFFKSVFEEDAE